MSWHKELEDSGYTAGLSGQRMEEASRWSEVWDTRGTNDPAWLISGWIAGNAMRRFREEMATQP